MFVMEVGDLFTAPVDAIAHGCNCVGLMGSGVAKLVRARYGEDMYQEYRAQCDSKQLSPGWSQVWTRDTVYPPLFNLGTQRQPGPAARYEYIGMAVRHMCNRCMDERALADVRHIGIPALGCGIGGLEIEVVVKVLEKVMEDFPEMGLTMYVLPASGR